MKLLLTILACLVAASAGAQTIKSLGYNTTNGKVVYSGTNTLAFTNLSGVVLQNGPLAVSEIQDNSGNSIFMVNDQYFVNVSANGGAALDWGGSSVIVGLPISFAASSNAATTRTNLGLGATNNVTFSNVTASGTLAVTGNVTLSGVNNTMPNATTADSASSLMTRDLVAQRLPFQLLNYDPVTSAMGAVTSSNGGSGTPSVNKFDLRGGTNTNGVAVWGAGSGGGLGIKSSARGNVGWQGRVSVGWSISRILTNSEVRLQFGKDNSDRNFTALGARGVGIYISNSSVFFETHDGTNHFQTTNSLTTSGDSQNDSWMAVTSNGVASFYKNGTLITNVTNNVPNSQSSSAAFGYVIGVQNTTTNNSGIRIFTTPGFILQD